MTDNNEDTTTATDAVAAADPDAAVVDVADDTAVDVTSPPSSTVADAAATPAAAAVAAKDEKKETEDNTTAAAKQTLKDLIYITDGGTDAVEAEVTSTDDDWEEEKHPFQKAVEDLTGSVRGGFQTHVVPKVDELVSNTQFLLDTHLTPHIKGVQEHSARAVQGLQENTTKAVKGVQEHSTRAIQGVQETTVKAWQATEQSTKQFHSQHLAPHLEKATTATRLFHQDHVQPNLDKMVHESTRAIQATGSCFQRSVSHTKQVIVQHRHLYWNIAPNLFGPYSQDHDATYTHQQPWYMIWQEGTWRSFGQVIFCNNPLSGMFIWLAILLASPVAAFCSLVCVMMVRVTRVTWPMLPMFVCVCVCMSVSFQNSTTTKPTSSSFYFFLFYNTDQFDRVVFGYGPYQASSWAFCC
jgi:hypothetical protein